MLMIVDKLGDPDRENKPWMPEKSTRKRLFFPGSWNFLNKCEVERKMFICVLGRDCLV